MRLWRSIAVFVVLLASVVPALRATAQESSLVDLLPSATEIEPGFTVGDDRARTLEEQATGFADASEAAQRLADWDWQENAYQIAAGGDPKQTIEISLTRFADDNGAAQALTYFLEDRAALLGQAEVRDLDPVGDEARALSGFVKGGFDYTLYARSGSLLIRISATAAAGSPTVSPEQIARGIIARANERQQPAVADLAVADYLPDALPLADTTCTWNDADSKLDVPSFIERFDGVPDAAATLQGMGWQEGAYRQFACDNPPPGSVGWVNLGVHRFVDAQSAADAVAFFADARAQVTELQAAPAIDLGDSAAALTGPTVNGTEYTLFLSDGPLLFRVTGVAPDGDPRADVEAIATALDERSRGNAPSASPTAMPTSTPEPIVVTPPPTIAPISAGTPSPTREPIPTAPPRPTATPIPTPPPTAVPTEVPTTIPVAVPTTAPPPQPTTTTGPLPTPTPRVIHPPVQTGE
jgi:hypothetical protein